MLQASPNYYIPVRYFSVFGFKIYFYAVCIIIGIVLAAVSSALLFKRRNIPTDWVLDLLLFILPLGIIGARTFYCLTDPNTSMAEWFTGFRDGGLSILGGVIGGTIGIAAFCLVHKLNFLRVADCIVPGVALAQAAGRWGNFFNQEVYGAVVTNPSMQWFPFAVYIEKVQEWHYAFFFYESVLNILIFALLFTLMWKFKKKPHGLSVAGYLFGYGLIRSIMEPLRDSRFILGSNVQISQVFSLLMLVIGLAIFVTILVINRRQNGKLFGAIEGREPLAIMPKYYTKDQLRKQEADKNERLRAVQQAEKEKKKTGGTSNDSESDGK